MVSSSGKKVKLHVEIAGDGPPVLLLHGFPDSLRMWDKVKPLLLNAGYKVISYDQRGFGESDAPKAVSDYQMATIIADAIEVLQNAEVTEKLRLVGHDWGSIIGWMLAIQHPDLVHNYTAISVGHPKAYKSAGIEQKKKSWYILAFQLRGVAELMFEANNFEHLRQLSRDEAETQRWVADLSRRGRLTAGLSWYRANFSALLKSQFGDCTVPVMGIYSTGDVALTEQQMVNSEKYVKAQWRYERIENCGHWIPTERPDLLASLLIDWFKN